MEMVAYYIHVAHRMAEQIYEAMAADYHNEALLLSLFRSENRSLYRGKEVHAKV